MNDAKEGKLATEKTPHNSAHQPLLCPNAPTGPAPPPAPLLHHLPKILWTGSHPPSRNLSNSSTAKMAPQVIRWGIISTGRIATKFSMARSLPLGPHMI